MTDPSEETANDKKDTAMADDADDNKKQDDETPSASPEEMLEAVKERLLFFFSDANLRQDMFLRKLLLEPVKDDKPAEGDDDDKEKPKDDKDEKNNVGQVPIESLLRFNTIKKHTTDPAVVVQAAKALAGTLAVSDDDKLIRRVKPFTRDQLDDNLALTLLVRNLPLAKDGKRTVYDVTVDEIKALFETTKEFEGCKVALVKLRFRRQYQKKGDDPDDDLVPSERENMGQGKRKIPDGSCLVEFATREDLKKVAANVCATTKEDDSDEETTTPPKQLLTLKDNKLEIFELDKYVALSRKKRKLAEAEGGDDTTKDEKDATPDSPAADAPAPFVVDWKPGCVIRLQGLPAECDREAIMDAIAAGFAITVDQVKEKKIYVDYSRGQKDGAIRFAEPVDDIRTLAENLKTGEQQIKGAKIESAELLQGEEEKKYWDDFIEFKNKQIQNKFNERQARKQRHSSPRKNKRSRRY